MRRRPAWHPLQPAAGLPIPHHDTASGSGVGISIRQNLHSALQVADAKSRGTPQKKGERIKPCAAFHVRVRMLLAMVFGRQDGKTQMLLPWLTTFWHRPKLPLVHCHDDLRLCFARVLIPAEALPPNCECKRHCSQGFRNTRVRHSSCDNDCADHHASQLL
jgi:hypothetical protein